MTEKDPKTPEEEREDVPSTWMGVTLRFHMDRNIMDPEEPLDYCIPFEADIIGNFELMSDSLPEHSLEDVTMGHVSFMLVRVGAAMENGVPSEYLFDNTSELFHLSDALYAAPGYEDFHPHIQNRFGAANPFEDLLHIDNIFLEPWARGKRLGLAVIETILRDWSSGCSFAVIDPFPMQFFNIALEDPELASVAPGEYPGDKDQCIRRLRRYFSKIGFEHLKNTPYMLRAPSESVRMRVE